MAQNVMAETGIDHHRTLIASHRGGADLWPENSMTAFRNTRALATDQVEFDVHPTADGEIVVHHDPTIDRMTDGTGEIAGMTFAALSSHTINGTDADKIPLLDDVVALFRDGPIDLRLEIKAGADKHRYRGLEAKVAEILIAHDMLRRTTVTSFQIDTLTTFRSIAPDRPLIWLISSEVFRQCGGIDAVLLIAANKEIGEIAVRENDLADDHVAIARGAGVALGAYAVNDEAAIRRVWPMGLSAFTTNRPDIAVAVRDTESK
jgi:glycerophosphoryl diester phosphodiesterase